MSSDCTAVAYCIQQPIRFDKYTKLSAMVLQGLLQSAMKAVSHLVCRPVELGPDLLWPCKGMLDNCLRPSKSCKPHSSRSQSTHDAWAHHELSLLDVSMCVHSHSCLQRYIAPAWLLYMSVAWSCVYLVSLKSSKQSAMTLQTVKLGKPLTKVHAMLDKNFSNAWQICMQCLA